jgi:hypothetical protein
MIKAAIRPLLAADRCPAWNLFKLWGKSPKEAAMTRSKLSTRAVLLAGAIGLSTALFAASQPAAAQSYSDEYSCPAGYVYDPTYGCTLPGDADGLYDDGYYGYLPYGTYGSDYGAGHREFGHGFAHGMGASVNDGGVNILRGSPSQGSARLGGDGLNHAMTGGISNDDDHGPGFAHFGGGGFGHGIGGGFGHGMAGGFGGFHGGGGFGGGGHR